MFNESTLQHSHFLLISRIVNYSREEKIFSQYEGLKYCAGQWRDLKRQAEKHCCTLSVYGPHAIANRLCGRCNAALLETAFESVTHHPSNSLNFCSA